MPEQTPPNDQQPAAPTEAQIRADLRAKALVEERAALEKLTKAELIERVQSARTESEEAREALRDRQRQRARPEDAMVVTALLELHKVTDAEKRQGSTIRGRRSDVIPPRYLEAARALGDELVDAILGPNAKV